MTIEAIEKKKQKKRDEKYVAPVGYYQKGRNRCIKHHQKNIMKSEIL